MKSYFYLLFLTCNFLLQIVAENSHPFSVVIIGAGPAGLGSAIEARSFGAQVVIVEKRENSTRSQTLFLQDSSLNLLKKWQVTLSKMTVVSLQNKQ